MERETFINLVNEIEKAIRNNKKKIDQGMGGRTWLMK